MMLWKMYFLSNKAIFVSMLDFREVISHMNVNPGMLVKANLWASASLKEFCLGQESPVKLPDMAGQPTPPNVPPSEIRA